jgi:hypothetical protein
MNPSLNIKPPYFEHMYLPHFQKNSSWLWVHQVEVYNTFFNSKSNKGLSKDLKLLEALSVHVTSS